MEDRPLPFQLEAMYQPLRVTGRRHGIDGRLQYRVLYNEARPHEACWEYADTLECDDLIQEYLATQEPPRPLALTPPSTPAASSNGWLTPPDPGTPSQEDEQAARILQHLGSDAGLPLLVQQGHPVEAVVDERRDLFGREQLLLRFAGQTFVDDQWLLADLMHNRIAAERFYEMLRKIPRGRSMSRGGPWEIKRYLDQRRDLGDCLRYLIRWRDRGSQYDCWAPINEVWHPVLQARFYAGRRVIPSRGMNPIPRAVVTADSWPVRLTLREPAGFQTIIDELSGYPVYGDTAELRALIRNFRRVPSLSPQPYPQGYTLHFRVELCYVRLNPRPGRLSLTRHLAASAFEIFRVIFHMRARGGFMVIYADDILVVTVDSPLL